MDKPTCLASGCERIGGTRGLCGMHYMRWWKHGTTEDPAVSCFGCGSNFKPRSANFKFCSNSCANAWNRKNNPRKCEVAGCERGHDAKGMCTMHYRRNARAVGAESNDQWSERRKANYHQRRALKLQIPAESIRPADVYERDEWVCGICAEPVDRNLSWPDPMSPSLDHVLPLSLGGHHTMENVALAHLSCNVRKGNRVEADAMSV